MKLSEPALIVEKEPDYFSRGHFYNGTRPHISPAAIWKLPIGTKLYTAEALRLEREARLEAQARIAELQDRINHADRDQAAAVAEARRDPASEPVAWLYRVPICDASGTLIGYSEWKISTDESGGFLSWWPNKPIYTAEALRLEREAGRRERDDEMSELVEALAKLLSSDPDGAIATASNSDLVSAIDDADADPVVRAQAAAVLQARAVLAKHRREG